MTKSEQKVLDRVRAENDGGNTCFRPVGKTKGTYTGNRWHGRSGQKPIKAEQSAFDRLFQDGALVYAIGTGGYVVEGHPLLAKLAGDLDLERYRKAVDEAAYVLETRERYLETAAAFKRKHGRT